MTKNVQRSWNDGNKILDIDGENTRMYRKQVRAKSQPRWMINRGGRGSH